MVRKNLFFKNNLFIILIVIFTFSLFVSEGQLNAEASSNGSNTKLKQIKAAGKIVVGTSADYPPFQFYLLSDKEGELVGIDIDIAKVIAKELGVKLEIKDLIFSKIFNALDAGQIDIGIAGLTPTEERRKKAFFSDIYYRAIQTILIHSNNAEKISAIGDLRGKKVGIQKDSIQEDMAQSLAKGAHFEVRETIEELVIILEKGLVDAVIFEKPVADSYVQRNKKLLCVKLETEDNIVGSAIAVKKSNSDLLKEINRILKKLKRENKIMEFVENAKILTNKR